MESIPLLISLQFRQSNRQLKTSCLFLKVLLSCIMAPRKAKAAGMAPSSHHQRKSRVPNQRNPQSRRPKRGCTTSCTRENPGIAKMTERSLPSPATLSTLDVAGMELGVVAGVWGAATTQLPLRITPLLISHLSPSKRSRDLEEAVACLVPEVASTMAELC